MRWTAAPWLAGLAAAALFSACRADDIVPSPPSSAVGGSGGAGQGGAAPDAGLGGGGAGGAGGAAAGLSFMTWNLETFPLAQDTASRVVQIFSDLNPDVVAVQEIEDPDAFLALPNAMPGYAAVLNDDPGAFLRVGLLYNTARIELSEVETLFYGDFYAFPRPPLKARVSALGAGPPGLDFVTVVLHLKAQLDADSQARRRAACEALDVWVRAALSAGPELDFVLAGDWNDELTDPAQYNVFEVFLDAPDTYTFLTLPAAQAGEFSYIPFESMIDHVLITTDALGEVGDGTTEVLHLEGSYPDYEARVSDHRPIFTRFAGPTP
jgi:endonuclease/exonuclease/phosphatase family metal-dependent hydrolase